ncbi:MAG: hypothetical protein RW306_05745 [Geobacteraceae bacterium]|nr:hypothetical protein [Geobacteraceae bacterium]
MKRIFNNIPLNLFFLRLPLLIVVLLATAQPALCNDESDQEMLTDDDVVADDVDGYQHAAVYAGYRFITPVDNPAAAAPYLRLKSGASGGFSVGTVGSDLKLLAETQFLHADDYNAGLVLDYSGLYRLKIQSTSLWHNLERTPPVSIASVTAREFDNGSSYGARAVISRADNRIKLGNNPVHLNLNYWQLTREGTTQLRFSDYSFDGNPNSTATRSIPVDNVTREGSIGLDAHLGPVNGAYLFTIRDFTNQAPDNRYQFAARDTLAHDVINDSRLVSHTFKLFSDLSGGLTTSALYSISRHEAGTDHGDTRPSTAPVVTLQTAAGDVSYTPFKELMLAVKYRRLQIDRESPSTLYSPLSVPPAATSLSVRPSSSSLKDTVIVSASYRPQLKVVYRFEYRAEVESRDDLRDLQSAVPNATKKDSRQTHTGKAAFIWKPLDGVKLNASYSYAETDNPAYQSSFSERHNGQALISYTSNGRWGVTASYLGRFEKGESNYDQTPLPVESLSTSVNCNAWFSPMQRVTVNAGYSFQQLHTEQASIYTYFGENEIELPIRASGSYRSTAHVYSLDTVVALTKILDLSLALQQTFSDVRFSASDNSIDSTKYSAVGIGDQSRLVSTSTSLTSRADLRLSKHLGCSLGYSFRMLNAGQPSLDGAAHETLLALTGRW